MREGLSVSVGRVSALVREGLSVSEGGSLPAKWLSQRGLVAGPSRSAFALSQGHERFGQSVG